MRRFKWVTKMTSKGALKRSYKRTRMPASHRLKSKQFLFKNVYSLSESVPDWEREIGGLGKVKEQVEEIFGITQRYSLFFKG